MGYTHRVTLYKFIIYTVCMYIISLLPKPAIRVYASVPNVNKEIEFRLSAPWELKNIYLTMWGS